jgi:hypothetical protein
MMLITAVLLVLAIVVASFLALARAVGTEELPMMTPVVEALLSVLGKIFAWLFLIVIFYLFYRFAPARTLHERELLIASLKRNHSLRDRVGFLPGTWPLLATL